MPRETSSRPDQLVYNPAIQVEVAGSAVGLPPGFCASLSPRPNGSFLVCHLNLACRACVGVFYFAAWAQLGSRLWEIMKLTTGRFGGAKNFVGTLPKFGVYRLEDWELLGSDSVALSLHQTYQSAEDAAAKMEDGGVRQRLECVLVQFDYSEIQPAQRAPLTKRREDSSS